METAGFLPLALSAEGYLELLPTRWQAINSYGIKSNHRIYDCDELNDLRRPKSGIAEPKNRREVRHDPCDIRVVWLRNHRTEDPSHPSLHHPWSQPRPRARSNETGQRSR
ncbi:hypothetical protein AB0D78_39205 [Streptomyces avermitilis]|uniref:hypothetical protein n=1 Tax=Streptomyces avermitilis TaxID=33903 RepID=UPI0033AE5DC1